MPSPNVTPPNGTPPIVPPNAPPPRRSPLLPGGWIALVLLLVLGTIYLFQDTSKEITYDQFKNLANEILEEKSKRFSEQNQTSLGLLLDPLKLKITEFQTKVEDVYVKEGKDRTALAEQVRQLMDLNQSLSQDAKNLTRALNPTL